MFLWWTQKEDSKPWRQSFYSCKRSSVKQVNRHLAERCDITALLQEVHLKHLTTAEPSEASETGSEQTQVWFL